jgi:predicted enzyme related to lactoylglutathione lyase
MPEITRYAPGVPCWTDRHVLTDSAVPRAFYSGLFGWDAEDVGDYVLFRLHGLDVAGLRPPDWDTPALWSVYLASVDVDATVEAAQAAGATVLVPPFDLFDAGRVAVLEDPAGAPIGVWQGKRLVGARLQAEPNALAWCQLNVWEAEPALAFYSSVFGYEVKEMDLGAGPFWLLYVEGKVVAMAFAFPPGFPGQLHPHWMPHFRVESADASAARAADLGGKVISAPEDFPFGRMASLSDAEGAAVSIIELDPDFDWPLS